MDLGYETEQPTPEDVAALEGPAVVVFGTNWCGYCIQAEPAFTKVFGDAPRVQIIRAEDGRGRPLGRSFGVKLWPTAIFLRDGEEVTRLVRPTRADDVAEALAQIV